jgi:hypothetical protein
MGGGLLPQRGRDGHTNVGLRGRQRCRLISSDASALFSESMTQLHEQQQDCAREERFCCLEMQRHLPLFLSVQLCGCNIFLFSLCCLVCDLGCVVLEEVCLVLGLIDPESSSVSVER